MVAPLENHLARLGLQFSNAPSPAALQNAENLLDHPQHGSPLAVSGSDFYPDCTEPFHGGACWQAERTVMKANTKGYLPKIIGLILAYGFTLGLLGAAAFSVGMAHAADLASKCAPLATSVSDSSEGSSVSILANSS